MRLKTYLKLGLIVLVAFTILVSAMPAVGVHAVSFTRFWGQVSLSGVAVPAGSLVSARINGLAMAWSDSVIVNDGVSYYIIDVPENTGGTGNKNGGNDGDIVLFEVNINGDVRTDPGTAKVLSGTLVYHKIDLPTTNILTIVTTSLTSGNQWSQYSCTVSATGGVSPYTWGSSGLPAGLSININSGVISGAATVFGVFPVTITVTDNSNPKVAKSRNYILTVTAVVNPLTIVTSILPRHSLEVFPPGYPTNWNPLPPPGWIVGQAYSANLVANGGTGALSWNATNLPPGLSLSIQGVLSGTPTASGTYNITFTVRDSASPPVSQSVVLTLKIYLVGDANGNDTVAVSDVTYVENAILGIKPPTAGCDANLNNAITVADVTKIERIILGLP